MKQFSKSISNPLNFPYGYFFRHVSKTMKIFYKVNLKILLISLNLL
ncbi:hypothetical protein HMPREF0542_11422 [Ligilactobacillus ruminis ATCC 25644]|uniref:Uncharacterized protein n=1 Tax=Ligilactobacillus ruminis ATCC 25644 TaxID=525362 RepID=E7FR95_9LACO|nr:hypothetical protein HMPREF0542_11422 [Ligilactobacillus ruminis ATCC 25644]EGX97559.1 hypothetical protein ANHS_1772 [Ligilactobacillus ruminis ATCC 25644]